MRRGHLRRSRRAHELWQHWEQPRIGWYPGSHVSFLWEPAVKAFLLEAFRESKLLPESYEG